MTTSTMTTRTRVISGVFIAIALTVAALSFTRWSDSPSRQESIAERGSTVMPFDSERTTHRFDPTTDGGIQTVVADDPTDQTQVGLVQEHLREEAEAFARGEFGDPAQIHGADMPGLDTLEEGYDRIDISYDRQAEGATIRYATSDPELVTALHEWFAAQTSDHGEHSG